MYLLTLELKDFSAAHRLVKSYRGKCNNLHGHNYLLNLVIGAASLGADGLVIDFSQVRTLCNTWVQTNLDHCTLVYEGDKKLYQFLVEHNQKLYLLTDNTSVEVLAKEIHKNFITILESLNQKQQHTLALYEVELWESKECGVIYTETAVVRRGVSCGESTLSYHL